MNSKNILTNRFIVVFLLITSVVFGQNTKQEKMQALSFMVGEWIGTSKGFENGKITREVAAYQEIAYDLDQHILVIKLNSESLLLHTIIYYDQTDDTYYYHPFSKRGMKRSPAKFEDGKLVVWNSDTRRYTFSRTEDGGFREHGEQFIDGKWVTYFEDIFQNSN